MRHGNDLIWALFRIWQLVIAISLKICFQSLILGKLVLSLVPGLHLHSPPRMTERKWTNEAEIDECIPPPFSLNDLVMSVLITFFQLVIWLRVDYRRSQSRRWIPAVCCTRTCSCPKPVTTARWKWRTTTITTRGWRRRRRPPRRRCRRRTNNRRTCTITTHGPYSTEPTSRTGRSIRPSIH